MAYEESQGPSLRARQRALAIDSLSAAALNLFLTLGFEVTTVDDIARAAGTSRRTFFRYFKTKEEVVLSRMKRLYDVMAFEVAARPPSGTALKTLHEVLRATSGPHAEHKEQTLALVRLIYKTPTLHASILLQNHNFALELAEMLTRRDPTLGFGPARLAAVVAFAAADAATALWLEGSGEYLDYLDDAFADFDRLCATGAAHEPPAPSAQP